MVHQVVRAKALFSAAFRPGGPGVVHVVRQKGQWVVHLVHLPRGGPVDQPGNLRFFGYWAWSRVDHPKKG